jgi:hypothetical protein
MVESKEELQKILNDFWLLDLDDYENLESMISQEIYGIDQMLLENPDEDGVEKHARDQLILLREKIRYIISNSLYKK